MKRSTTAALLLAAALSGCRGDGVGPHGPSWFRASLEGEVNAQYEGTGDFSFLRDYAESPRYFRIYSTGLDTVVRETFHIRWPEARQPAPGTYALVPHTDAFGSTQGVSGVYLWHRGDNVTAPAQSERYVATGGTIEITRSTQEEVEGTIRFSGTLVERRGTGAPERLDPQERPDPAAPKIEVTGSFRLIRFDENAVVVRTGA